MTGPRSRKLIPKRKKKSESVVRLCRICHMPIKGPNMFYHSKNCHRRVTDAIADGWENWDGWEVWEEA